LYAKLLVANAHSNKMGKVDKNAAAFNIAPTTSQAVQTLAYSKTPRMLTFY